MKNTAKMLGLPDDASESQINAAIDALQVKANAFDATAAKLADIATVHALETGRIKAGEVDTQKALIAKQPVEGTNALMARERMSAIPQPTTGEKKVDGAGAPPDTTSAWAKLASADDATLGEWYAAVDSNTRAQLGQYNPALFARASNAWRRAQGIVN